MSKHVLNLVILLCACSISAQMFEQIDPSTSGITFRNDIIESDSFNILVDFQIYNGGGVAVGDLDGDGLLDVVFTSTIRGITHYRNTGGLTFADVSEKSGLIIRDSAINTGLLIADLTGDGKPDVYICRRYEPNRLFVNSGNGTFVDASAGSALSFTGFSTCATVLDYDRDGDLDLFVVNGGEPRKMGYLNPGRSDKLFRNNGNGVFADVTVQSGLVDKGYGLSASVGDINQDGWPDIYVANDFEERDNTWINQRNGTFGDSSLKALANMSWASMGSEIADLNGDGLMDVMTVDMLPHDNFRRQTQLGGMSIYGPFFDSLQRVHNTLQLNRGNGRFSNVCYLAGMAATDWSWTVLAGDMDLDGRLDLFITNGTKRDIGDQDYSNNLYAGSGKILADAYLKMPKSKLTNFLFHNEGGFRFADVSAQEGMTERAVSNGASMADLDNDGDLDLIVNNTDTVATLLANRTVEHSAASLHWIGLALGGPAGNVAAVGANVGVYSGDNVVVREVSLARGFLSTSDSRIHVGLGRNAMIDSVVIRWPNGLVSTHVGLTADTYNEVVMPADAHTWIAPRLAPPMMSELPLETMPFVHRENSFDDFKRERLVPYRFSRDGPGITVGDVNGDKLDDVIFTGAKFHPTQCFLQQRNGLFLLWPCGIDDVINAEDVDVALLDIDGDKDLDLVVVSGGNEFDDQDPELADRLYRNDGKGQFTRIVNGLPGGNFPGSCIAASDYDNDGDVDLFIGGRVAPGRFPELVRSILYRNDRGVFHDVTDNVASGLSSVGMTTRAVWADIDGDKDPDLIVVGEWITPRIWRNDKGHFVDASEATGMTGYEGWWSAVDAADIDGDGDIDLIIGNVGLNCRFVPEPGKPILCYVGDFDDNGSIDPIITYDVNGRRVPTRGRVMLTQHMPSLTRKFNTYAQFAVATIDSVLPLAAKDTAQILAVREFASMVFVNQGGRFVARPLPDLAQISPVKAIATRDLDGDGDVDVILAGNTKTADGDIIGYDAGIGLVLINDGKGILTPVEPRESGFSAPFEVRHLAILSRVDASEVLCLAINGQSPRLFSLPPIEKPSSRKR